MRNLSSLLRDLYPLDDGAMCRLLARFQDAVDAARRRRSAALKAWDDSREASWITGPGHVVYVAYPQLLTAGMTGGSPLARLPERLDYLQELGVTNLHLLPLMRSSGDAGFAVDDYLCVEPRFGTNEELAAGIAAAHSRGVAITLDLVLNHTSDAHEWATRAKQGDAHYRAFFVEDETGTGAHWPGVPDIFPDFAPGHWDWVPEIETYMWSTFYSRQPRREGPVLNDFAQWDLNYGNPEVLLAMSETLLAVANLGVDCMRLDAAPFLWKQPGTSCTSRPELHLILRVFRAVLDAVAPKVALLAEANDVLENLVPYFGSSETTGREAQLCYAFPFMPFLWHAVAFADAGPLETVLAAAPPPPEGCAWLVFDEVHDEVSLEIVEAITPGSVGKAQNRRLFEHFTAPGRGVPFRFDPEAQEYGYGFSGTRWTLLDGETSVREGDTEGEERALEQTLLLEALKLTLAGVPLVYSGQELGADSDWSFRDDPGRRDDTRFLKRVALRPESVAARQDEAGRPGRIFQATRRLLAARAAELDFAATASQTIHLTEGPEVLVIGRGEGVLAVFHFGDEATTLEFLSEPPVGPFQCLLEGSDRETLTGLSLAPRSYQWFKAAYTPDREEGAK